jgi:hypothetical protein
MLLPKGPYYEDRPVLHVAQGDFYAQVPTPIAIGKSRSKARGARKRPLAFIRPEPTGEGVVAPVQPLVVLCTYTCGFVAQPPGQQGYSHPMRQVAPVVPLIDLVSKGGLQRTEARRLKDSGFLAGLLYVPRPPQHPVEPTLRSDEEFSDDDYAVCLYGMATVDQSVLEECARVARMTLPAQKLLTAALISLVSPSLYKPGDLEDPDMSCSWSVRL